MNILLVHQHYLFPGEPGGSRFNEMVGHWVAAGHRVTVIGGTVNYATGRTGNRYRGRWVTRESGADRHIDVWRCHVPPSYARSYVGRMWAFVGFTLSAASAVFIAPQPDVVIATSPPLVTVIPAWIAARVRRRGIPWVFEVRDLWPESAVTTGVLQPESLLTRLLYRLERWAARAADRIVVLTPAFRDDLTRRRLAPGNKIAFVPNGADLELFRPADVSRRTALRRALGWSDKFVVLYAGAHGRANALDQLLNAARLLSDRPDILLVSVGDGPDRPRLETRIHQEGVTNVRIIGPRAKDEMPSLIAACDVGAAFLQNNPTFRTVYPNKVFDYMACARPTLLAVDGVARQLVCEDAKAGVYAEPENAGRIAEVIRLLANDPATCRRMGERGRAWVMANASRASLAHRYLEILSTLAAGRSGDGLPASELTAKSAAS